MGLSKVVLDYHVRRDVDLWLGVPVQLGSPTPTSLLGTSRGMLLD